MTSIAGAEAKSGRGYASQRDFNRGPATYSDADFLKKIAGAAGLFTSRKHLLVADYMSGPGSLGLKLQALTPQHAFLFVDANPQQAVKAQSASKDELRNQAVAADVRYLPLVNQSVDAVVVRYGLKDLTRDEKVATLAEIRRTMKPGALLGVGDMVAPPDHEVQGWLNLQHSLKQAFEWRNPQVDGLCHIPTVDELLNSLREAGFRAGVWNTHTSFVDTQNWVDGNQVTEDQLKQLNKFILAAPDSAKEAFKIRREKGRVKINYPLVVIRALNPINK